MSFIQLLYSSKRFVNSFSLLLYPPIRSITSLIASRVSILGRGQVMRLLFWDKLEPFVMVINHNGQL